MSFTTTHTRNYFFSGLIALATALFLWVLVMPSVRAETTAGTDEHLVTIHDRGKEKSVISKKDTLGEVLREAGVTLDTNDIVEPGVSEKLIAPSYQINIYRARPVVVVDGANKLLVMSAYQTPRLIADHAGIMLHDQDAATMSISDNFIRDGASVVLTIDRAAQINLTLYGKKQTVYTQAGNVADFMKEKNIKLAANDTLSVGRSAAVTAGMSIEIWRNGKQTVTQEEPVAFETEQVRDANQPVGYKNVQTPGKDGKRTVTYEIEVKNGKEVARKEIQSVVIDKAVKQVEVIGVKVQLPAGSHTDWMAAAGISPNDYGYVDYIFTRESGWNPVASNGGRYVGLGQTSPANLSAACPSWQSDPICQIRFFNGYANGRYGGWANAYNFWTSHHWW